MPFSDADIAEASPVAFTPSDLARPLTGCLVPDDIFFNAVATSTVVGGKSDVAGVGGSRVSPFSVEDDPFVRMVAGKRCAVQIGGDKAGVCQSGD